MEVIEKKEFKEERFEFALFVNNKLICKRNFRINDYIQDSMQSLEFKQGMDEVCRMIDNDLKSKSRVYTWYYFNPNEPDSDFNKEFNSDLLEPWECTFKFVVTDNHREVYCRIWDGYGYPKAIRDKVDIVNKYVKILNADGELLNISKEDYFEKNKDRLSFDKMVLRGMIYDKPDLLIEITHRICDLCSPREDMFNATSDYTLSVNYNTVDVKKNEDGSLSCVGINKEQSKKYMLSPSAMQRKLVAEWGKSVSAKTKEYLATLY